MNPRSIIIEVRDANANRVAAVRRDTSELSATIRVSAIGEWTLRLPADGLPAAKLAEPGAGIIVTGNAGTKPITLFSGPVEKTQLTYSTDAPAGILTATGFTDEAILFWRIIASQVSASGRGQTSKDVSETVWKMLNANVDRTLQPRPEYSGDYAARTARCIGIKLVLDDQTPIDHPVRPALTWRFDSVGTAMQELCSAWGLSWRCVQDHRSLGVSPGYAERLRLTVRKVARPKLSGSSADAPLVLSAALGSVVALSAERSAPTMTRVTVAGQGEGAARQTQERVTTTTDETLWGKTWGRREGYLDQRQTNVVAELQAAGDAALVETGSASTAIALPSERLLSSYLDHWQLGDLADVELTPGVTTQSQIVSVTLLVSGDQVKLGCEVGKFAEVTPSQMIDSRLKSIDARLAYLERV